jgi:hypothetical protein
VPVPVSLIGIVIPCGPCRATSFALASARWYSTVRWLRNSPRRSRCSRRRRRAERPRAPRALACRMCWGHVCARSPPVARSSSRARSAHRPVPRPSYVSSAAWSRIRRIDPAPVAAQALAAGEEATGPDLVLPAGYSHSTGPQTFVHIWPPYPNTNHNRSRAAGPPNRVLGHRPRRGATTIQD